MGRAGEHYADAAGNILLRLGQLQGEKSTNLGNAIGGSLASLGQMIGQEPQRQLQQQELQARIADAQSLGQERQLKAQQYQDAQKGQTLLTQALNDPANVNQSGAIDHVKVADAVSKGGAPTVANAYLKVASENAAALDGLKERQRKQQDEGLDSVATILKNASSPEEFDAGLALAVKSGAPIDGPTADKISKAAHDAGPDGFKQVQQQLYAISPSGKAEAAATMKARVERAGRVPTTASIALDAAGGDPNVALESLKPPKEPATKGLQSEDVLLDGKPAKVTFDPSTGIRKNAAGEDVTSRVRPMPPSSVVYGVPESGNARQEQDNAKTVAQGIIDGDTAPSILEGTRGTAQGIALMAEIKKQGGDSNKILREWIGAKRAISSLNSTSQLRLAETINKASESLNKLDELNQQWADAAPRFGIKLVNHASLKAAQNGADGPDAASIAQRLEGQIADVTAEIGQGIMGGNSPTDQALKLAGKNLSADWTQKVLADSIKQARYNLNLAQNARNELLGGLGNTSTQVQTPNAAPKRQYYDASGKPMAGPQ